MNELVGIGSAGLTARINPLGAELWSLTDAAGAEYMTDADPAFWTGHAPILFPVVGALNANTVHVDGKAYPMGKHGFARASRFARVQTAADRARFRLTDSPESRAQYPFAFVLELDFWIAHMTLTITATVHNPGTAPLPFSFGFHPAFAWPLPGGTDEAAHRVTFAEDEPQPIRRIDPPSGLLLPQPFATPVEGRELAPDAAMFAPDALIWDRLHSHAASFGAPGGARIDLAFPDTDMLGIWQKPGAHYLCIEPWAGIADPQGFTGELRDKPGIRELAPGARTSFRLGITVTPAPGDPTP